jgi:chromatin assembly factor 1 subunit A
MLIPVLPVSFPKVSKDTLKDTVNAVAVRVGQKEADKKWTCK